MENAQTVAEVKKTSLGEAVNIIYLTPENAEFGRKNEFLTLRAKLPKEEGSVFPESGNGTEGADGWTLWPRVYLHRAFPFDRPFEFISVLDKDMKEIGLIHSLEAFGDEAKKLLVSELERKYYAPVITAVYSVKEKYGFSYWRVGTAEGELSFTLQDTYRSILKVGDGRLFIIDMDGNRYELPNVEALDFKSYKKLELYL